MVVVIQGEHEQLNAALAVEVNRLISCTAARRATKSPSLSLSLSLSFGVFKSKFGPDGVQHPCNGSDSETARLDELKNSYLPNLPSKTDCAVLCSDILSQMARMCRIELQSQGKKRHAHFPRAGLCIKNGVSFEILTP